MCVRGDDRKILRVHGVPKVDEQNVCASDWKECGSLCGQHASKKHTGGRALEWPSRNLWYPSVVQHEIESKQMCVWGDYRKIPRVHGVLKRYWGQPRQDIGNIRDEAVNKHQRVQSLNGKVIALNRFVSRATNKCLPFFRMLKKSFEWSVEC